MADKYGNIVHHVWQEMTSEDKRYAAEHLNETDEIREIAIAEIRHWIKESDDFPAEIDDFFILRFLRVGKFDFEKTKSRIQNYYKQRSKLPEWYRNKDPFQPELQDLLDLGIHLPLRKLDSQGRLVMLMRPTLHDPERNKISDITKAYILAMEAAVKHYPTTSLYGCLLFIDLTNVTTRQMFHLKPYDIMNYVQLWQNCYPMRFQKIVFFNTPIIFDIVVRIFKSFMTKKMKSRFYIYSNALHCFEDIPANILPVEYGGTAGTFQELTEYWKKDIEENRDWLMKDENDQPIQTDELEKTNFEEITHL
ncbi:retinol-binding protein pinta-like [Monomorium pharaonis]|uniref:retinol-binding protein pinta-like n=1 Tax=Monomorium pharaonis TaxID=307658 RepID=UPI001747A1ED|nr:retinol-binding protein pinta-like [Monomorium pharaonis]